MSGAGQRQMERVSGASPLPVGGADAMQRPARQSQPLLPGKRRAGGRPSRNSSPDRVADRGASSHHLPRAHSRAASQNNLPLMRGGEVQAWLITGDNPPRRHQCATAAQWDKSHHASPLPRMMLTAGVSGVCPNQIVRGAPSLMLVGVPRTLPPRGKRQKHQRVKPHQPARVQILDRYRHLRSAACLI